MVALKNAAGRVAWRTGNYNSSVPDDDGTDVLDDIPESENCGNSGEMCYNDISGLQSYQAVLSLVEKKLSGDFSLVPAFKAVKEFDLPAPARTTGWFMPSAGQLYDLFDATCAIGDFSGYDWTASNEWRFDWPGESVLRHLNGYFGAMDADVFTEENVRYWTTTEQWAGNVFAFLLTKNEGRTVLRSIRAPKGGQEGYYNVRPILAF